MNGLKWVYECIRIKQKMFNWNIEMYIAEKFVLNGNVSLYFIWNKTVLLSFLFICF